ncbi:MAG: hypothetical protein ACK47B_00250 [Armatimonadota bacterium]
MNTLKLPRSVKSVVILDNNPVDCRPRVLVSDDRRKPKKSSKALRGLEKAIHRMSLAQTAASSAYLSRHRRSNARKKDGWLKDLGVNVPKAARTGMKRLKIQRLFWS